MSCTRLLVEADETKIFDLLDQEPSFNGLIKSDLKRNSYASVAMYGSFVKDVLTSAVFIFRDKIAYYGLAETNVTPFVPYILSSNITKIVGKAALIERFVPLLDIKSVSDSFILELNKEPLIVENSDVLVRKIETADELRRLHSLLRQVEEYSWIDPNVERWVEGQLNAVASGTMRTVYAEVDGAMVSTAASIGETSETAILAGVATPHEFRNRGFASVLVSALSKEVIHDGKTMYLFYNNPDAGSIYKRLGFHEGGAWKVLQLH